MLLLREATIFKLIPRVELRNNISLMANNIKKIRSIDDEG